MLSLETHLKEMAVIVSAYKSQVLETMSTEEDTVNPFCPFITSSHVVPPSKLYCHLENKIPPWKVGVIRIVSGEKVAPPSVLLNTVESATTLTDFAATPSFWQLHENTFVTVSSPNVIGILKVPVSARIVVPALTVKLILADDFVTVIPFAEGISPIVKSVWGVVPCDTFTSV